MISIHIIPIEEACKVTWRPSSLEISSMEKVKLGMNPLFFNKMIAKNCNKPTLNWKLFRAKQHKIKQLPFLLININAPYH
jgi:hypothetical protein